MPIAPRPRTAADRHRAARIFQHWQQHRRVPDVGVGCQIIARPATDVRRRIADRQISQLHRPRSGIGRRLQHPLPHDRIGLAASQHDQPIERQGRHRLSAHADDNCVAPPRPHVARAEPIERGEDRAHLGQHFFIHASGKSPCSANAGDSSAASSAGPKPTSVSMACCRTLGAMRIADDEYQLPQPSQFLGRQIRGRLGRLLRSPRGIGRKLALPADPAKRRSPGSVRPQLLLGTQLLPELFVIPFRSLD